MIDLDPSTEWVVLRPGVIGLPTTDITISLKTDWSAGDRYQVMWNYRVITETATLPFAKMEAQKWLGELLSMGMEP